MSATVDQQAPAQRLGSWRDTIVAQYETDQARLRVHVAEDPEEYL